MSELGKQTKMHNTFDASQANHFDRLNKFAIGWFVLICLVVVFRFEAIMQAEMELVVEVDPAQRFVVKRSNKKELFDVDKITQRLSKLMYGLDRDVLDASELAQSIFARTANNMTTSDIDELAIKHVVAKNSLHPNYNTLAARIMASNLHKNTPPTFLEAMRILHGNTIPKNNLRAPVVAKELIEFAEKHEARIEREVARRHARDYEMEFQSLSKLFDGYLSKAFFGEEMRVVERPQYLFMRVALGINLQSQDIDSALRSYEVFSDFRYTHATPSLFTIGSPAPRPASCFLLTIGDSIDEQFWMNWKIAQISKNAGGVGMDVTRVRGQGSHIASTNGTSDGVLGILGVLNRTAKYVNQAGKRPGSFAAYLQPWHVDTLKFLAFKDPHGSLPEDDKCFYLFQALWVPDLFMKRVENNQMWSFFCPHDVEQKVDPVTNKVTPSLADAWGDEFEQLYEKYESQGLARSTMPAHDLWNLIVSVQFATGLPYLLFKDACNRKSNHNHLGPIRSSNLCTEIVQYTSDKEIAVCNLASLSLSALVKPQPAGFAKFEHAYNSKTHFFDFDEMCETVALMVENVNKVIDISTYPCEEARLSNRLHRPMGLGVQGLADAFAILKTHYGSEESMRLNRDIFETLYFASLDASCDLAKSQGTYESYKGSCVSRGILQFDMWNVEPSSRHDWPALRARIDKHGLRNSLLVAPMPTASTSQLLGNNESFEPFHAVLYKHVVTKNEYVVLNRYFVREMLSLGLWTPSMADQVLTGRGSIQNVKGIPDDIKLRYRTAWEIGMKTLCDMAIQRGPFIDQSQSFNVFVARQEAPSHNERGEELSHAEKLAFNNEATKQAKIRLGRQQFHAWRGGLKTGSYYMKTKSLASAMVVSNKVGQEAKQEEVLQQALDSTSIEEDACAMCGS